MQHLHMLNRGDCSLCSMSAHAQCGCLPHLVCKVNIANSVAKMKDFWQRWRKSKKSFVFAKKSFVSTTKWQKLTWLTILNTQTQTDSSDLLVNLVLSFGWTARLSNRCEWFHRINWFRASGMAFSFLQCPTNIPKPKYTFSSTETY